jgi:hypothetical protein
LKNFLRQTNNAIKQQTITGNINNKLNMFEDIDNDANKNLALEKPPILYIIQIHDINITISVIIPQIIFLIKNIFIY